MKYAFALALSLSAFLGQSAYGAYTGPVLVRDFTSGETLPENSKTERCEIYGERVVLRTTRFDGKVSETTKEMYPAFTADDAMKLVRLLSKVPLRLESGYVDGPKITYTGFLLQPDSSVQPLMIGEDNGSTAEFRSRDSIGARLLRSYIDAICI